MYSSEKLPGTIIIGTLRFVISFVTNEVIIGPGSLLFSSDLAARTKTLIFFSSSMSFLSSDIVSPSLSDNAGNSPILFLTNDAASFSLDSASSSASATRHLL